MEGNTTYCYKGSDFVIENGISKGAEVSCITRHNNYGGVILKKLEANPNIIGQINGATGKEERLGKMMEKSVKCAMWLKEQNIQPGDIIGICTHNQIDMYVPCFASLYIGSAFNPWWSDGITKEMTKHFLTLTRPKILFADEASAGLILKVAEEVDIPLKVIVFGKLPGFLSLDDILASQDSKILAEFRCATLSSNTHPAVILYTSGSTGLPKGVLHSHKSLFGNVNNYVSAANCEATTISLTFSPLAWTTGVLGMLWGVIRLETRIIYPEFSEEIVFQLIQKYKVNWLLLGTSATIRLEKSPARSKYDLSSLQTLCVTGSVLKEKIQKAMAISLPNTSILQAYGTTEMGAIVLAQNDTHQKLGSCGRIFKNMQMKVIDIESGVILGPNQTGEAYCKSPFMMTCYYKNPKATSEAVDDEGWLHTGDLVHYDEEGNVFITDRIKDMIKYRGNHVSPAMIEQVLQTHPAVLEVGVVAKPNDIDDEHAIAFVVKRPNAQVTKEELLKLVTDKLPDNMKLRGGLEFIKELPHTSSGKMNKSNLRVIAQAGKA